MVTGTGQPRRKPRSTWRASGGAAGGASGRDSEQLHLVAVPHLHPPEHGALHVDVLGSPGVLRHHWRGAARRHGTWKGHSGRLRVTLVALAWRAVDTGGS